METILKAPRIEGWGQIQESWFLIFYLTDD